MGWGLMLTHKKCAMTSNILSRRVLTFYFVVKEIPSEHNIQKFLLKICWISKCSPGEELTPLFPLLSEMILAWKGREVNDKALRLRHEGTSLVVQWLRLCAPKAGAWGLDPDLPSQVALVVKNPLANAGDIRDMGLIPGLERSPGGGHGNPLWYCLENPMGREAWRAIVHRVTQSWARLKRLSTHAGN